MRESDPFEPFAAKMRAAGLSESAVRSFEANFRALSRNETGLMPEAGLEPVTELPRAAALSDPGAGRFGSLMRETVVIKLNGGLGTGMGLEKAKSLLTVREGLTFLDLIVRQVLLLRERAGSAGVPRLLLMNSFSTSGDTLAFLAKYPEFGNAGELELMQSMVPKVLVDGLRPLDWSAQPDLEWCPPGHGDLYASLAGSGWLDRLLGEGMRYAFVSNSDNLGATLDPSLLAWFAASGASFAMEVTQRTEADRKGGHLARRKADGRLVLRESAQCPREDEAAFQDIGRHRYFNTNNLWLRLDRLREALDAGGGYLPLPMIRNAKTADPRDPGSMPVYQLETAMGAAIESFAGAQAIEVGRSRFAPVKTTSDLLVVRSSACRLTDDHRIELDPVRRGQPPLVELDGRFYRFVDGLGELVPDGVPCLRECRKLSVRGRLRFARGVVLRGDVSFVHDGDGVREVAPGNYGSPTEEAS
jgi:UTP--glucose-1-phosphate uridylyltransferase